MRKLILSALLLALAFQAVLGEQSGDWTYIVSTNQATITAYAGAGGAVAIPSVVNGISVTSIGWSAFANRASITSVTIPNSVTSIEEGAFGACTSLTSVTIPNSVTSIGNWAFNSCTSLTSIEVVPNNPTYTSVGGILYDKNQTTLIHCPEGKSGSVTIPSSVTSIGNWAFNSCTSLTSITIPNSVTSIGDGAFQSCTSLTSITIPSSVTSIGESAFYGCTSLTSLTIPNGVVSILGTTFAYCTSLTSLTIPNSVTSIGMEAFIGCTSLASISLPPALATDLKYSGVNGQVASDAIVQTIANALANNDAFVTAVANTILAKSGNYGLSVKSELETLATKTELTSSLTQSRTDGINSVLSNPNLWTLYTTSQIQNMAVGNLVLTKNVGGTFTLNYDIEQSTDLQTWTTYQALSLPLTSLPTDKAFVRIKAK